MKKLSYKRGTSKDLDLIRPLWEKLNQHHFELSENFKESFQSMTWEFRRNNLESKSAEILLDYVTDENNSIIAYCVSTIDKNDLKVGEIDSLLVDQAYRKFGIGKTLVEKAIEWLLLKDTEKQILTVGTGNEEVLTFYERFDFYPRSIKLERINRK